MDNAWMVWDIFAIIVLMFSVNKCVNQGLISTIIGFIGFLVAIVCARKFSAIASEYLYNNFVKNLLEKIVTNRIDSASTGDASDILELIPKGIIDAISTSGNALMDVLTGENSSVMAKAIVSSVLREPAMSILSAILFFVIFAIAIKIANWMASIFIGVRDIPIIGLVNSILGGVIGVLQGGLILYLVGIVANIIILLTKNELIWLNKNILDSTLILRIFFKIS